jgi:excisionase family DNA binding protein
MLRRLPVQSLLIAPNTICRPTIAKRGRTDRAAPFFFFCMSTGQEQTNTLPRVFAIAELAQHLRLSRRTIVSALSSGVLDHYRVGSRALIPEPAVIAWLESQRVGRRARLRVA